jgi:pyruvate carboxylase
VTSVLYPRVFEDFAKHQLEYSDTSTLPTPVFFYGLEAGEEIAIDIEMGKTLIVRYLTTGIPHPDGRRSVFFELNGQPRDVLVMDNFHEPDVEANPKADTNDPNHVGVQMPGMVVTVAVEPGSKVSKGQKLFTLEAMKMETTVAADGVVASVLVKTGSQVETGDLMLTYE